MFDPAKLRRLQAILGWLFLLLFAATAMLAREATVNPTVRGFMLATVLCGILNLALYLLRILSLYPALRFPALLILTFLIVWISVHKKTFNQPELRERYIIELRSYQGSPYVWGGESKAGIDCSGLARVALWRAMISRAVREINPMLLTPRFWSFWWQDLSVRDIRDGKLGFTRQIPPGNLQVGDLAVNADCVLIYTGRNGWIEASSREKRVVLRNKFQPSGSLLRWWVLE